MMFIGRVHCYQHERLSRTLLWESVPDLPYSASSFSYLVQVSKDKILLSLIPDSLEMEYFCTGMSAGLTTKLTM